MRRRPGLGWQEWLGCLYMLEKEHYEPYESPQQRPHVPLPADPLLNRRADQQQDAREKVAVPERLSPHAKLPAKRRLIQDMPSHHEYGPSKENPRFQREQQECDPLGFRWLQRRHLR